MSRDWRIERAFPCTTVDGTYEEGPGGAGNANRDHDDTPVEEGAAMTDTTAATAIREGEVR